MKLETPSCRLNMKGSTIFRRGCNLSAFFRRCDTSCRARVAEFLLPVVVSTGLS